MDETSGSVGENIRNRNRSELTGCKALRLLRPAGIASAPAKSNQLSQRAANNSLKYAKRQQTKIKVESSASSALREQTAG